MRPLNGILKTILALLLLLADAAASAQSPFGAGGARHMRASLVAETARPLPGSRVSIAIVMQPEQGWHGYWSNPGDAGAGMTLDWALPAGVRVGPLRYPVPGRLLIAGLMNHVHEGAYAVLTEIAVPADARPGTRLPISAQGRWLVCTNSLCVPEEGRVAAELIVGDGVIASADRARFDTWRAALPRPLDQPAGYALTGDRLAIAVPYPDSAPVADPWFYALTRERVAYAEPQRARRVGDQLVIETKLAPDAAREGVIEGVLAVSPGVALSLRATPGAVPAGGVSIGGGGVADAASGGLTAQALLLTLAAAFLGGVILNVMPCVFPILSLKALSLARAGGDERRARAEALAYTAGILVTCLALGAVMLAIRAGGAEIGWAFQLQHPGVIALLLLLMIAITLNLAGLFDLAAIDAGQGMAARGGTGGAFWTGMLAAFVATPCTGPFMGAAMGAALVLPWPLALLVFMGLGLGLAAPFLAIAFLPALRARLPRPGPWMARLKAVLAIPMGLTAVGLLWLLWRQTGTGGLALGLGLAMLAGTLLALLGRRQRRGLATGKRVIGALGLALAGVAMIGPAVLGNRTSGAVIASGHVPFSEAKLAELRQSGKPVFLYFTADWCLTCKVNEAGALSDKAVGDAFAKAGIVMMVGDWTRADPAITRFLERHGRSGVPFYIYYAPGASEPRILQQILTPAMLTGLADG